MSSVDITSDLAPLIKRSSFCPVKAVSSSVDVSPQRNLGAVSLKG